MSRCLVDTAVFVYAAGRPHRYRSPCRAIVERAAAGSLGLEASVALVQEYAHVMTRSDRDRGWSLERAAEVAGLCRLHRVELDDGELMLTLLGRHAWLQPQDALYAATALNRGIPAIVTPDSDFDDIPGLDRIDPADESAVAALAG